MFGSSLVAHLLPQQVALMRSHRRLRGDEEKLSEIKTDAAIEDPQAWAIEACSELLARNRHTGNLHVIFSDLWTRYDLIQLGESQLSDEDAMSLARAQFSRQYPGADSVSWPLRLARQGKQLLVAGLDPSILAAATQMASASGKRLVRAEPLFAKIFDQYEKEFAGAEGWILFDEPGMLIAAFMEQGQLFSIHCQRSDESEREQAAHLLLERQSALIARPAGKVRIFSYSGASLALQEPWHASQFRIIGHVGGTSAARPK